MTIVEQSETDRIEALLKQDANGHVTAEERAWLRSPENLDSVYVVLKVLVAKLTSQIEIAEGGLSRNPNYSDPEWQRKVRSLVAKTKPLLVEFEGLYEARRRSDLRSAIRRHRTALIAADGEPEPYDEELWRHVE